MRLIAQGTVQQVVGQSHLATYVVTGPDLRSSADELRRRAGIDMVRPVRGEPACLRPRRRQAQGAVDSIGIIPRFPGQTAEPSLEDVFIEMMRHSQDNCQ